MSGKRKTAALEATPDPTGDEPREKMVIRVRRGALRRFDLLSAKSSGLPVEVKWDRRVTDRRAAERPAAGERRTRDRRQQAPYTWDVADFLVVGDSSRSEPEAPINGRKKR
jgi:hypothetical protein